MRKLNLDEPSTITYTVRVNKIFDYRKIYDFINVRKNLNPVRNKKNEIVEFETFPNDGDITYMQCIGESIGEKKISPKIKNTKKPKRHFRNQTMIEIFVDQSPGSSENNPFSPRNLETSSTQKTRGKWKIFNCMIFKSCFKIVGCKKIEDAMNVVSRLWGNHLYSMFETSDAKFTFEISLLNTGFNIGFNVDLDKLSKFIDGSSEKFGNILSFQRSSSSIRLKYKSIKPGGMRYDSLEYSETFNPKNDYKICPVRSETTENKFDKNEKEITFIIFSSGEIIIMGSFKNDMLEKYTLLEEMLLKFQKNIEEKLSKPGEIPKSVLRILEILKSKISENI